MPAVRFTRRFSMAHRLIADAGSKCAVPHGHNEFVTVTLEPTAEIDFGGANYAASFERLKARWHGFVDRSLDHAFQLNRADPLLAWFQQHEPHRLNQVLTVDGDPTTEALVIALWRKLEAILAAEGLPFRLAELAIEETPTNTVLTRGLTEAERAWALGAWCDRADFSINDLLPPETWS
ncbi:6-pyruvoyl tetrahydropterin synthase [Brevundimonas naejangsanensis]|uniref:6-carboxy-5,6,7,8-tetrahydropterin synthase n=1 Tax=Brevundimonas naejangsanensis TaxID=588932 RepID=A0A172Y7E3_9CAUL|nr:6-carboxytetrahydropterin synthase [Brevundimonas naejangsanensis]ANF55076.1 6-pyruvoyl tetrahydropterin synthase [Brevundimonas naejangsanensis]